MGRSPLAEIRTLITPAAAVAEHDHAIDARIGHEVLPSASTGALF